MLDSKYQVDDEACLRGGWKSYSIIHILIYHHIRNAGSYTSVMFSLSTDIQYSCFVILFIYLQLFFNSHSQVVHQWFGDLVGFCWWNDYWMIGNQFLRSFQYRTGSLTSKVVRICTINPLCLNHIKADTSVLGWQILKVVYCRLVHKSALLKFFDEWLGSLLPVAKHRMCLSHVLPVLCQFIVQKLELFQDKSLHCWCTLLKI